MRSLRWAGSSRVWFLASTNHPRTALVVFQDPSPALSFLTDTGSLAFG